MKPGNLACPVCGGRMLSRLNKAKQQRFWGCANFPSCRGTRDTDGNAPQARPHDMEGSDGGALPSDRQRAQDRRRWDA